MASTLKDTIARLADGKRLSREETRATFDVLMAGEATPAQIAAVLMALRMRGESVEEITGAVASMRGCMSGVRAPADCVDIVGTGGDTKGTYNISTTAAIVTAACGIPVAKHGNRAVSSKSGASDVLTALGVTIKLEVERVEEILAQIGLVFLFAPTHHAAVRHVAPVRVELGVRTIFNILGPMCNPAGAPIQLIGVYDKTLLQPLAETLRNLGSKAVWITHGHDGLDEITVTGPTYVCELRGDTICSFEVTPESVGLKVWSPDALLGGNPEENAVALREVLNGAKNAYRDAVLMNAGAAVYLHGSVESLGRGVEKAANAIDSGAAHEKLNQLVAATSGKSS